MQNLKRFYGPNAGYVLELYERYQQNPESVDAATRAIFESWTPEDLKDLQPAQSQQTSANVHEDIPAYSRTQVLKILGASNYAHAIRVKGHLGAHLDPLGSEPMGDPTLLPETYDITNEDLTQLSPKTIGGHSAEGAENALEAIHALKRMYSGTISYRV